MEIINIKETKSVEDWDFNFINGSADTQSVDAANGDTVDYEPGGTTITFHIKPRLSPYNPDVLIPGEEVIIPLMNVVRIRKRVRIVEPETPELSEDFYNMIQELGDSPITH